MRSILVALLLAVAATARAQSTGWQYGQPFTLNTASPQANGLVAWWPTVDYAGGALTNRAGTNHAAAVGAVTTVEDPDLHRMLHFDGDTGDYFSVPDAPEVSPTGNFSVAYWFRSPLVESNTTVGILGKGINYPRTGTQFVSMKVYVPGIIDFNVGDGTTTYWASESDTPLKDDTLYHIVGVRNGTQLCCYANGKLQKYQPVWPAPPGPLYHSPDPLLIGRMQADACNGDLADIRIYNRSLTAAEVTNLYDVATRFDLYAPVSSGTLLSVAER